ncbi:HlyD family secretion protein [Agrobacterium bohemicum]|uniref:Hemolysin D n=1 Tax=Agrobacterium bohemicum TaxID=2052828 RepID=A0A135NY40_9HYPH|nr:HlyD family secretion protein [Agrobacterium bohemicum]KXG84092.1 hemolysin D [Agrobacterium bohemicum]
MDAGPIVKTPVRTRSSRSVRTLILGMIVLAGGVATAYYLNRYITHGQYIVSTDNAYVKADATIVAPRISGYISAVVVGDNEQIKSGQTLARIDDRDYQVALDQAKANVAGASAALASKKALLYSQKSVIEAAQAAVSIDEANAAFAEQDAKRYSTLAASNSGSVQNAQQAETRRAVSRATLERDSAVLITARKQVDLLKADVDQARAALVHSQAIERQAALNLTYTLIVAPLDGTVGNRTLRVGQYVQAGTQLMAVVPLASVYIVANYKETQLRDVREGQPVDLEVDMLSGMTLRGHVDSIAPASGQEFALLPPDNATGNFTKIVQRIPVRIRVDDFVGHEGTLRPGMSLEASIDTRSGS